jgi:hypothetical protein
MNRTKVCSAIALLSLMPLLVSFPASAQTKTPVVKERQENQQSRIKDGVKDDELTRREAARLRAEQAKIQAEKEAAKADGKVTASERAKIQRDQNKASRHIARQKHDKQERKN